uniref:Protein SHQ1 homolog n=2 Tax=Panagrolaimus sp. PS1159 TaxID=55785 RepID=A0AC35G951_9BILA
MITPKFAVNQTDEHVIVEIDVPSARLEDADVEFSENLFIFSCKPYYLRLHFTNSIRSIDQEKDISKVISFDFEKSSIKIQMTKNVFGEEFGNFNDLKKLLNPSTTSDVTELAGGMFNADGEAVEEFLKQELPIDDEKASQSNEVIKKYGYGFAFKKHGELGTFKDELNDLFDIAKFIENFEIDKRSEFAHDLDLGKFDPQYFLADYFDPPGELAECLAFKFPDSLSLTDEDKDELLNIRKKELPKLDDMDLRHTLLGLLDILFAYVYDYKVNLGETTCESSWTYVKLAPTFSCLACYETVREAFLSGIRRSLCYGLYRNWDFAISCVDEVEKIINQGPNAIIHCLLQIRKSLAVEIHYRYLLNKLFIDDYIIFLQDLPSNDFSWLPIEISYVKKRIKINDTFMEYDLEECIKEAGLDSLQIAGGENAEENVPLDSDDDDA